MVFVNEHIKNHCHKTVIGLSNTADVEAMSLLAEKCCHLVSDLVYTPQKSWQWCRPII